MNMIMKGEEIKSWQQVGVACFEITARDTARNLRVIGDKF
jgi:hypothetical protein